MQPRNVTSPDSQKFLWSKNSTPIPTVHNGNIYALKGSTGKSYPVNVHIYGKPAKQE